ncbi:hypothetical protein GCM10010885_04020 [Alicyclobacillus cellulosilyticus]|uniref:TMEM205-like domain-containing protein n=1 Tax=Alicyclobacillus cellulosilyticus TaxID=1003997 RepID=A0A917NG16_9BACL|nr:DUF4149 domain-containing protein [Alicyclobacillus cellulosilyticus]GGI97565.1 hypothetical protein GCM10010885_04020 [Alicyclobacillus cellulosilyticus]
MRSFFRWLLYLGLSVWLGSAVYFSFFVAAKVFSRLSEDEAANVVQLLFPDFFLLCAVASILVLLLYTALAGRTPRMAFWVGNVSAWAGALAASANRWLILPHIERIERAMGPVSRAPQAQLRQFGMWHGVSMSLDLLGIVAAALIALCLAIQAEQRDHGRLW